MSRLLRLILLTAGFATAFASPVSAGGSEPGGWLRDEPLAVRNLAPVTHLYGLPQARGRLATAGMEAQLTVAHANNFTAQEQDGVVTIFDGSTSVASLAVRGRWGARWEWAVEVPLVHHGGGFTDGLIDGFHDVFGFPDGNRELVARDRLDYRVFYRGERVVDVGGGSGAGDVRVSLGVPVHQAPRREAVVRAMVELPTGESDDLTGSGSTDVALWLEVVDAGWLERVNTTVTLAAGVTLPGNGELLAELQRDAVFSGHLGLHYALSARVTLKAQLDGHSGVFDDAAAPLGQEGLLGTLGGSIMLSPTWRLDLGLVEDLSPHQAPDVIFLLGLGARF